MPKEQILNDIYKKISAFKENKDINKSFFFEFRQALNEGVEDVAEKSLDYAIENFHSEAFAAIIEAGVIVDKFHLEKLIETRQTSLIELCVKKNLNIYNNIPQVAEFTTNISTPVIKKINTELVFREDIVKKREEKEVSNLLKNIVVQGDLSIIKQQYEAGANVFADDDFLLRTAALQGYLDIVEYLVDKGANVQAHNNQALKKAYMQNKDETARKLIELGADHKSILEFKLRNNVYNYAMSLDNPMSKLMTPEQRISKKSWIDKKKIQRYLELSGYLFKEKSEKNEKFKHFKENKQFLNIQDKLDLAIEMRENQNKKFKEIGEMLDVSTVRAHEIYKAACSMRKINNHKPKI